MSRAIPTTIGPHAVHLVPPVSARQRLATFGPFWASYDKIQRISKDEGAGLVAIALASVERDRGAASALLSMASSGSEPCGLATVDRYLRAEFADAGGIDAAVTALLDELDAQGIPAADLEVAISEALRVGSQPTAPEVEHARGK